VTSTARFDLLTALLDFIADEAESLRQEPKVIFLGDIVSRRRSYAEAARLVAVGRSDFTAPDSS
jgi:hypothetical protein